MFLLDRFFDGTFFTFGIEVMSFAERDQEDRIDPMVYIFPRMTKCTFHKFGTSGEVEKHDALCILPLNIFNEKIYIFLWFWYVHARKESTKITGYYLKNMLKMSVGFQVCHTDIVDTTRGRLSCSYLRFRRSPCIPAQD